jgi:hypothetical protein
MNAINTRQAEAKRLAAHLTATVSYLWIKSLLAILLSALLGTSLLADRPRPPSHRSDRRPTRTQARTGSVLGVPGAGAARR